MKRIVSIAAAVFIALFLSFLGLSFTEKINRYNEGRVNSIDKPNIVFETPETNIWDFIKEYNSKSTEESKVSEITTTVVKQTEEDNTETTRYSPRENKKKNKTTTETTETEETTEQTKLTIVVR
ncbi:MAG: hypothetical protein GX286_03770 [Clostridiales bacterium]|jgi:ABC-type proline/glycine betaine transport system ATPase subunit|nr:hypothetical protein [Clostridiales bacterium]